MTTTAGSGIEEVHALQCMLLRTLGVKVVAKLDTYGYFPNTLRDPVEARKAANAAAEAAFPYVIGEKRVESDPEMEELFQAMKSKSVGAREWLPGDYAYWERNGMVALNSYAELLAHIRDGKMSRD